MHNNIILEIFPHEYIYKIICIIDVLRYSMVSPKNPLPLPLFLLIESLVVGKGLSQVGYHQAVQIGQHLKDKTSFQYPGKN